MDAGSGLDSLGWGQKKLFHQGCEWARPGSGSAVPGSAVGCKPRSPTLGLRAASLPLSSFVISPSQA